MSIAIETTKTDGLQIPPRLIAGGVVAMLALIFVFRNTDSRTVNFFRDIEAPAWLWLLVLFAAGVVGSMFPWLRPKKKA